jgi:hypothetical protein
MRTTLLAAASIAAIACSADITAVSEVDHLGIAPSSASVLRLVGNGYSEAMNVHLTLAVTSTGEAVHGYANVRGGLSGKVITMVPPSGPVSHWCVTIVTGDELNFLWYIRDIGDGKATFDELSFAAGLGITCVDIPSPTEPFIPLSQGDYKAEG